MNAVLGNELAKLRHLRVGVVAAMLVVGILGLTLVGMLSSGSGEPSWALPLAGISLAVPLVSPLLIAVVASRTVEIEHQGNGWLMNETLGVDRGRLCRAKWVAAGLVVVLATVVASLAVLGIGTFLGITAPLPAGLWVGFTVSVVVINLVVLALHLLISAAVDNQLVALGVGILGTVVAIVATGAPSWIAHVLPWGYYALVTAADYQGEQAVTLSPSYASVAALAVVGAAAFAVMTHRLDRGEVRA